MRRCALMMEQDAWSAWNVLLLGQRFLGHMAVRAYAGGPSPPPPTSCVLCATSTFCFLNLPLVTPIVSQVPSHKRSLCFMYVLVSRDRA